MVESAPGPTASDAGRGPETLRRGILRENPILCQVLGVCSALAVTNRMDTTLVMSAALLFVACLSSFAVSIIRSWTPRRVRLITYMIVIATLVIVVDQYLKADFPKLSKALGPYVGLIITNCIVMGRCEVYASGNPPLRAVLDAAGNAAGYALVLCAIALVREPLGSGTLMGFRVMPAAYDPCQLMALAPGAFLAMGVLVWIVKARWPAEEPGPPRP